MANTFTQIHLQIICVVKYRQALIHPAWKSQLHAYITSIVQNNKHKMLAINSVPDHLHMLIGFRPHQSLADLMRMVKSESSKWINEKRLTSVEFHWQAGYAAFSYTKSLVSVVARYIENQEEHHKKESFQKEFEDLLNKFGVEYDQRYLFIAPE